MMNNTYTREEMIEIMDAEIEFAIGDYGWWHEDHWLTREEVANWTDDMFVAEFIHWQRERKHYPSCREWGTKGSVFDYDDPENF